MLTILSWLSSSLSGSAEHGCATFGSDVDDRLTSVADVVRQTHTTTSPTTGRESNGVRGHLTSTSTGQGVETWAARTAIVGQNGSASDGTTKTTDSSADGRGCGGRRRQRDTRLGSGTSRDDRSIRSSTIFPAIFRSINKNTRSDERKPNVAHGNGSHIELLCQVRGPRRGGEAAGRGG